ncbi:uncharacterized protein IUM83_16165 [Phytophthora cinnamomi]|uniref:uncharacterized protein n=1 Tax=Phytophthora cinnamomi TaxID=4785 RepID=UPI00355991CC|nr:hypothetical protein IUM83_16165 [Phytophthora cinnamomi]
MRNSSVRRINNAVRRLDWAVVENVLHPPDGSDGAPFELCSATRDDWNRYVQSEQQVLGSRWMAWSDDRVFIVELPETLHERLVDEVRHAITEATGTGRTHLVGHRASYIGNHTTLPDDINALLANLEPDVSFGPRRGVAGAVLPPRFSWAEFHTLKVEIGVYQGWGGRIQQQGQAGHQGQAGRRRVVTLNEKADAWRQCPGVEYVLCIRVSWRLRAREYRLDSIVDGQFENPDMQHAPVDNNTVVQFDPWRLLGIPHGAILPAGFNDPVQFNLFNIVDPIIQDRQAELEEQAAAAVVAAAASAADDDDDGDDDAGQPPRRRQRRH